MVTPAGEAFFARLGVELSDTREVARVFCRPCTDFSERRGGPRDIRKRRGALNPGWLHRHITAPA